MVFSRIKTLTAIVITIAVVTSGCGFTQTAPKADSGAVTVALSSGNSKPGGGPGSLESATIASISLEISASDMTTINTTIPTGTLETSLDVPAGENRIFMATVTIADQPFIGYATGVDIDAGASTTVIIDITIDGITYAIYTVGGSVSDLAGTGLTLQLSGAGGAISTSKAVTSSGSFAFTTDYFKTDEAYDVTVSANPTGPSQSCTVTNGVGTVSASNVTNVSVRCVTSTTPKSWGTRALIEDGIYGASFGSAYVATGAGGDTFAVWAQNNGSNLSIFANNKPASGSWGASADDIRLGTDLFFNDVSVSVDLNGNAMAVWTTFGTINGVWITFYVASNIPPWNPVEALISSPTLPAQNGHEAMFPDGNYIIIYTEFDGSGNSTVMERHTDPLTGGLLLATPIGSPSANAKSELKVAVSSNGTAIAVWSEDVGGNNWDIMASRFNGTNWDTTPTLLETLTGTFLVPSIAMDSSGNAVVVWYEAGTSNIYSNQYLVGSGGWQTASTISNTSESLVGVATAAMDGSGNAMAVWQQFSATSGVFNIWANTFDGSSWGTAEKLENIDTGDALNPRIAVDSSGNGMAVWHQSDGTRDNIWANFFDGANWGTAELIETNNVSDATNPWVAADPTTDNFTAVWTQDDGTGLWDIYTNIYQ